MAEEQDEIDTAPAEDDEVDDPETETEVDGYATISSSRSNIKNAAMGLGPSDFKAPVPTDYGDTGDAAR